MKANTFDGFVPSKIPRKELKTITAAMNGVEPVQFAKLWEMDTLYLLVWGKRSNGKTYGALDAAIEKYFDTGKKFALVRRWSEDFKRGRLQKMFQSLNENGRVLKWSGGKWSKIVVKNREMYLAKHDDDTNTDVLDAEPIGYAVAITDTEHDKGGGDLNIGTIIFDEFMTRSGSGYITDEFVLFSNVISTLKRQRRDVKVIMLANSVNQYCPYFNEMGLNDGQHAARNMKPGDVQLWQHGETGATILCCMTDSKVDPVYGTDPYFAFGNPRLEMITAGVWELAMYPHCPHKYKTTDVRFTFFIAFDDNLLQCEVVDGIERDDNGNMVQHFNFIFIHRKTTPIKDENRDLIYSPEYDPRPNHRRKITRPTYPVERRIAEYFRSENWYVQDNEVGEVVRNYLNWCATDKIT